MVRAGTFSNYVLPRVPPVIQLLIMSGNLVINVKDFGAVGNNIADDTSAIQAAIDSAYTNHAACVYMPAGTYKTSSALFLDAPGNLRSGLSSPTIFNFSLSLVGDPGLGNEEGCGTQIHPTASSFVALWVGTGNGMHVKSISIVGPTGTTRALLSTSGCAFACAGGNAGASRTLIEDCGVSNYYYGIATSFNGNGSLNDSNTIIKFFTDNCQFGVAFLQSQNFINSLYDCNIVNCGTAVSSTPHVPVQVVGGNYSNSGAGKNVFTISSVSTLSTFSDGIAGNTFTNYTFTAVVSSPDTLMNGAGYGACAIKTVGYGVIPLRLTGFNTGTNVATFSFWSYWRFAAFGPNFNVASSSDLQTEVQAATTLYACEWLTIFSGGEFAVKGVHIENPQSLTTLINATSGTIANCYFNYDIAHSDLSGSGSPNSAVWNCQQAFPFIINSQGNVHLIDNDFGQVTPTESVVIDVGSNARMVSDNNNLFSPNVRYCSGGGNITGSGGFDAFAAETKVRGHGEWDINPWPSQQAITNGVWANYWVKGYSINQAPARGYRPNPKTHPRLTPGQLTTINGGPGTLGTYPPLNGEAVYELLDYATTTATNIFARSAHQGYSYGQNLTTTNVSGLSWSYKGQSSVVTLNSVALGWMFPGLKIILNNGGGNQNYMVTEVHTALGYIVVNLIDENNTTLIGTKTSTYTGTLITQEVYSVTQYG
jgi:Pectate lyase superfamily protein